MIYRGTVTGTTSQGVWVRIPSLTGGADLGPLPAVPVDLLPGEGVLVTPVGGSLDDLLVLSRADEYYIAAAIAAALEAGLVAERLPVILVGSSTDLNDYVDNRTYHQNANAAATTGFNYPVAKAGLLEVRAAASMVYQRYTEYNSGTIWTRSKYATTWYGWKKTPDSTLATAAIDGLMPKADKAKLDAATASATDNTLVLRYNGGETNMKGIYLSAGPVSASHATRKDYVDGGDASTLASGKSYADTGDAATLVSAKAYAAPVSHTHSYANITGTVPTSALPPLAVIDTYTASSQAAMLALTAQRGDMCIRTDSVLTYVLTADTPSVLAAWKEIEAAGKVTSVASKTGTVLLVKADVGLGSVDNTSDAAKPVSTATQTALNLKANSASPTFTGTVTAPTIRLTNTGDASETSTGHAFQIGADSGTNLIIDNNEIIGRNNGALSPVFMPSGVSSLPAPTTPTMAANKQYVDDLDVASRAYSDGLVAKLPVASATGEVVFASVAAGGVSATQAITFPAGRFATPPRLSFGSNDARYSMGATSLTATGFNLRAFNYTTAASTAGVVWWTATEG